METRNQMQKWDTVDQHEGTIKPCWYAPVVFPLLLCSKAPVPFSFDRSMRISFSLVRFLFPVAATKSYCSTPSSISGTYVDLPVSPQKMVISSICHVAQKDRNCRVQIVTSHRSQHSQHVKRTWTKAEGLAPHPRWRTMSYKLPYLTQLFQSTTQRGN